jgi:hypothetical protein
MPTHRSLYPSPAKDIPGDLCLQTGKASSEQSQPKPAGEAQGTYGRLRKAAPANRVLPRTLKWAEELPAAVKPVALVRQFPRIANLIAAAWDDLVQFEIYMDSLLTDKRGGRKGFPAGVIAELTALDIHRHAARERELPPIPWSDARRRG